MAVATAGGLVAALAAALVVGTYEAVTVATGTILGSTIFISSYVAARLTDQANEVRFHSTH